MNAGKKTGGFKLTPESTKTEYDGIVYVFSREREASNALEKMSDNDVTAPLLDKHPGGIHVMYLSADGELKMLTSVPKGSLLK